jgi:GTPase SAR1 family protein
MWTQVIRSAVIIVFTFSASDRNSFQSIREKWATMVQQISPEAYSIVLATDCSKQREVSHYEGRTNLCTFNNPKGLNLAASLGACHYLEIEIVHKIALYQLKQDVLSLYEAVQDECHKSIALKKQKLCIRRSKFREHKDGQSLRVNPLLGLHRRLSSSQ